MHGVCSRYVYGFTGHLFIGDMQWSIWKKFPHRISLTPDLQITSPFSEMFVECSIASLKLCLSFPSATVWYWFNLSVRIMIIWCCWLPFHLFFVLHRGSPEREGGVSNSSLSPKRQSMSFASIFCKFSDCIMFRSVYIYSVFTNDIMTSSYFIWMKFPCAFHRHVHPVDLPGTPRVWLGTDLWLETLVE